MPEPRIISVDISHLVAAALAREPEDRREEEGDPPIFHPRLP